MITKELSIKDLIIKHGLCAKCVHFPVVDPERPTFCRHQVGVLAYPWGQRSPAKVFNCHFYQEDIEQQ